MGRILMNGSCKHAVAIATVETMMLCGSLDPMAIASLPGTNRLAEVGLGDSVAFSSVLPDAEAAEFARTTFRRISTAWDVEEFFRVAHPDVVRGQSRAAIDNKFFEFKKLGKLTSLGGVYGGGNILSLGIRADFSTTARFENGDARMTLKLERVAGEWKVGWFIVDSDALRDYQSKIQGNPSPVPIDVDAREYVSRLMASNDLARTRESRDLFRQVIQEYVSGSNNNDAIAVSRHYLRAVPSDTAEQLQFAELLEGKEHQAERRMRLEYVSRAAEERNLYERANALLDRMGVPRSSPENDAPTGRVDILFIAMGEFDRQVISEVAAKVRLETGLRIGVSDLRPPLSEPDKLGEKEYISRLFASITGSVSRLQLQHITRSGAELADIPDEKGQLAVVYDYLAMLGPTGERMKNTVDTQRQQSREWTAYHRDTVIGALRKAFPYRKEQATAYLGVVANDLFDAESLGLFGTTSDAYGVLSGFAFVDRGADRLQSRPRLVSRLAKQALSSGCLTLGIPRCDTPDCARAFPRSVDEQDMKSEHLCAICRAAVDVYKQTRKSRCAGHEYSAMARHLLETRSDVATACEYATRSIKNGCEDAAAYSLLGSCEELLSNTVSAAKAFSMSLALDKDVGPWPYMFFGNLSLSCGSNEDAYAQFKTAAEMKIKDPNALVGMAMAARNMGLFDEVTAIVRQVQPSTSSNAILYEIQGDCLFRQTNVQAAVVAYEKALALNDSSATCHYNLGLCLENLKRESEALTNYLRAAELRDDLFDAWIRAGRIYGKNGQFARAMPLFEAAVKSNPTNTTGHNDLGYTLYRAGKPQDALRQYDLGLRLAPRDGLLLFNKSVVLLELGRNEDAETSYRAAVEAGYPCVSQMERLFQTRNEDQRRSRPE